jgi:hypothetical protein
MFRYLLLLSLLPAAPLTAQPDATIHQEYRYQLPKSATPWTPVEGLPSGLRILSESNELWGAPHEAGDYVFGLRSGDGKQIELRLKVNALWNLSLTAPQAAVGVPFSHAQVVDGGMRPYSFSAVGLPPGLTISKEGTITGTPEKAGSYSGTVTVVDHAGNSLKLAYDLKVEAIGILPLVLPYAEAGKGYSQQFTATGGRPPYTWSVVDGSACLDQVQRPAGAIPENGTEVLLGIPGAAIRIRDPVAGAPFPVNRILAAEPPLKLAANGLLASDQPIPYDQILCVQVTDSAGNKTVSRRTVISLEPGDRSLAAYLSSSSVDVSLGDPLYLKLSQFDGLSPYTARARSLPPGLVFYPEQGIVFGYAQTPGRSTIQIEASDAASTVLCETTLSVSPIRWTGASAGPATIGKPYSLQLYSVGAVPPYTWTLASDDATFMGRLPAGLTFRPSGLISGTPEEAGLFFLAGRISDAAGNRRAVNLGLEVSVGTAKTLSISGYDTQFLRLGRQGSFAGSVYEGKAPYTWTLAGALPPGMAAQENPEGSFTFWGLPTAAGVYPVTLRVTDAQGAVGVRIVNFRVTPLAPESSSLRWSSGDGD